MGLARLLGFDLCPRLRELKQRHLFVPRGVKVPGEIAAVCEATIDTALIEEHWDSLVHLAASVSSGHASAVTALARFGSAARGDPIHDSGVQLGELLRTKQRDPSRIPDGCALRRADFGQGLSRAAFRQSFAYLSS